MKKTKQREILALVGILLFLAVLWTTVNAQAIMGWLNLSAQKADMVSELSHQPYENDGKKGILFKIDVKNIGYTAAGRSSLTITCQNKVITEKVPQLLAGQHSAVNRFVELPPTCQNSICIFKVAVDAYNQVNEKNEKNNIENVVIDLTE